MGCDFEASFGVVSGLLGVGFGLFRGWLGGGLHCTLDWA